MKTRPNQNETIYVHLIPFSKTFVGYKKTLDEYYSGANQAVQHASVSAILDSVVDELTEHPDFKYTFSEVKYLQMWYSR